MKRDVKYTGILTAVLGILIILIPIILPVCQGLLELANGKKVPMRCHWTVQTEMILGALIIVVGLFQFFAKSQNERRSLSLQVAFMGLVVVLIPLFIIPTCTDPEMACNIGTKPAILILGGITFMEGLYGGLTSHKEPGAASS